MDIGWTYYNEKHFCGFLCEPKITEESPSWYDIIHVTNKDLETLNSKKFIMFGMKLCDGVLDCTNTDLDEATCGQDDNNTSVYTSIMGADYMKHLVCDGVCQYQVRI